MSFWILLLGLFGFGTITSTETQMPQQTNKSGTEMGGLMEPGGIQDPQNEMGGLMEPGG